MKQKENNSLAKGIATIGIWLGTSIAMSLGGDSIISLMAMISTVVIWLD